VSTATKSAKVSTNNPKLIGCIEQVQALGKPEVIVRTLLIKAASVLFCIE
jgi:hypothetical protein